MDKLMQDGQGNYFVDAIGFESTHKIHRKLDSVTGQMINPGIRIQEAGNRDYLNTIKFDLYEAQRNIMNIDRSSIFIKSISGRKDATMSAGFANLMSNAAKKTLNNMNMIQDPINDLLNISAQTSQNPFAYKRLMKQILSSQHESEML